MPVLRDRNLAAASTAPQQADSTIGKPSLSFRLGISHARRRGWALVAARGVAPPNGAMRLGR